MRLLGRSQAQETVGSRRTPCRTETRKKPLQRFFGLSVQRRGVVDGQIKESTTICTLVVSAERQFQPRSATAESSKRDEPSKGHKKSRPHRALVGAFVGIESTGSDRCDHGQIDSHIRGRRKTTPPLTVESTFLSARTLFFPTSPH